MGRLGITFNYWGNNWMEDLEEYERRIARAAAIGFDLMSFSQDVLLPDHLHTGDHAKEKSAEPSQEDAEAVRKWGATPVTTMAGTAHPATSWRIGTWDSALKYAPDWRAVAEVATPFIDARVTRGFPYKYRVRFRTVDPSGHANVVTQFSAQTHQAPWS